MLNLTSFILVAFLRLDDRMFEAAPRDASLFGLGPNNLGGLSSPHTPGSLKTVSI